MKRHLAIALVLAAAGNAFADDITVDATPFTSTASRAQVQAELQQFRQSGVNPWAQTYNPLAQFSSNVTRAQVTAGYIASRDAVAAFGSEDSGAAYLARQQAADTIRLAGQPANAQ
jgi:hypothetical protein